MKSLSFQIPLIGNLHIATERNGAIHPHGLKMGTNLTALHRSKSKKKLYDLGSGTITNVGVMALANDFAWATGYNTLRLAKYVATGTGTTTPTTSNVKLQTPSGFSSVTAGTQTFVSTANSQKYQVVTTIAYTGTESVTEFGLFTQNVLSSTTGSPFTATTATTATVTSNPFTASTSSNPGQQQQIVLPGTTSVYGLILSNTTNVLTIPAWYKVSDGTIGSTPSGTETFTLAPVMFDHKVFTAIGVSSGDSITFTYTLTIASGG